MPNIEGHHTLDAFKLVPNCWYGWQMSPGYIGDGSVPYCSPILVREVCPVGVEPDRFMLWFWNALYAEGLQDFEKQLRVLEWSPNHPTAAIDSDPGLNRRAIISGIDFERIERHCPHILEARPVSRCSPSAQNPVSKYLSEVFFGTLSKVAVSRTAISQ
jgi:hypothetical protein